MKYQTSYDQSDVLSNKLGLLDPEDIALAEFEGFLQAELMLTAQLRSRTRFDTKFIQKIHQLALGEIYDFAGKWRSVNLSKGGFVFASAQFLSQTMQSFEAELLKPLPKSYKNKQLFIDDLARIHAELLFIHPFREGNGRTARILANLMCRKYNFEIPDWDIINTNSYFTAYVIAVQQAAGQNYQPMQRLMSRLL